MASFLYLIVDSLLAILSFAIIASAIISWLIAFDVINLRNRAAYSIVQFLDAVTRPILRPFQKIIPTLGGVDISPIVVLLVIWAFRQTLLPMARNALAPLIG
jgi:YggT family protein